MDVLRMLGDAQSTNNALTCGFERVRRIELPSSAWKAEVLAVELHPQLITMLQVGVYPEVQIRHNHDVKWVNGADTLSCLWIQK